MRNPLDPIAAIDSVFLSRRVDSAKSASNNLPLSSISEKKLSDLGRLLVDKSVLKFFVFDTPLRQIERCEIMPLRDGTSIWCQPGKLPHAEIGLADLSALHQAYHPPI